MLTGGLCFSEAICTLGAFIMSIVNSTIKLFDIKLFLGLFLAILIPVTGTILTDAPAIWPISTLIYNLGLLYSFAMAPKRVLRIIVYSIVAATFFVIETSFFFSYYLQNSGFNEAFFYHIRPDLVYAGVREHIPFLLLVIVCMLSFLFMSSLTVNESRPRNIRTLFAVFAIIIIGLFISPPVRALVLYVNNLSPTTAINGLFDNFPELRNSKVTVEFTKSKRPNIQFRSGCSIFIKINK